MKVELLMRLYEFYKLLMIMKEQQFNEEDFWFHFHNLI